MVRSCGHYFVKGFIDDEEVTQVRTYRVPPGTPALPFAHHFMFSDWFDHPLDAELLPDRVGFGPRGEWSAGKLFLSGWKPPTKSCGPLRVWQRGARVSAGDVPLKWSEAGASVCCNGPHFVPKIGPRVTFSARVVVEQAIKATLPPYLGVRAPTTAIKIVSAPVPLKLDVVSGTTREQTIATVAGLKAAFLAAAERAHEYPGLAALVAAFSAASERAHEYPGLAALVAGFPFTSERAHEYPGAAQIVAAFQAVSERAHEYPGLAALKAAFLAAVTREHSQAGLAALKVGFPFTSERAHEYAGLAALKTAFTASVVEEHAGASCSQISGGGPLQVTVTFSGVTNGICSNCGNFNGTHTLTYSTGCQWVGTGFQICGATGPLNLSGVASGGSTLWTLSHASGYQWTATTTWNGTSNLVLSGGAGPFCSNVPATVTIIPV